MAMRTTQTTNMKVRPTMADAVSVCLVSDRRKMSKRSVKLAWKVKAAHAGVQGRKSRQNMWRVSGRIEG